MDEGSHSVMVSGASQPAPCRGGTVRLVTTDHLEIRPFTADEASEALDLLALVFGEPLDAEDRRLETSVQDLSRSVAAFDGGRMAGCLADYPFDLSVPGGSLPTAGTTWVGVLPTHRRRGIMRAMVSRHLTSAAERGEVLAALWASEAGIYGRFGYGAALDMAHLSLRVDGGLAWHDRALPAADSVRLVPLDQAVAVIDPIYEACRGRRAGMHRRSIAFWRFQALSTRKSVLAGAAGKYVVVARVDGVDSAYAIYGMGEEHGDGGSPGNVLYLTELAGLTPSAEASMWRFLAAHDLITKVVARRRPTDDVLPLVLTDPRRVEQRRSDSLYVRVLDVPAALRGRQYADSADFTLRIHDDLLEANDGTWRVQVSSEDVSVEPISTETPDLEMDIRGFGSLYLGGRSLRRMADAGFVTVANPEVIHPFDAAFRAAEAGWAPEVW